MKAVIISKQLIKAKNGKQWTKCDALATKSGQPVQIFVETQEFDKYGVDDEYVVPQVEIVEFLAQYKNVDIDFNERGRIESVSVE